MSTATSAAGSCSSNSSKNQMHVRGMLLSGASASGKDHLMLLLQQEVESFVKEQGVGNAGEISFIPVTADMFYKELDEEQHQQAINSEYNFDEPDAIDGEALVDCCKQLSDPEREYVDLPLYDFITHKRKAQPNRVKLNKSDKRRIIVVQGIFVLCFEELRKWSNMSVFLITDPDVVALRRVHRDTLERGRDVAGVISQYTKTVKPGFHKHVEPAGKFADVSFPYNSVNPVLIETLALQLLFGKAKREQ